jgi:hypothetical protein
MLDNRGPPIKTGMIVNRIPEALFAPKISLRRLDGDVTQAETEFVPWSYDRFELRDVRLLRTAGQTKIVGVIGSRPGGTGRGLIFSEYVN